MNLPVILTIAGCVALLVGLFGGGVKAKEIEVPQISLLPRILSSLTGLVLIGIAIWILQNPPTGTPPAQNLPTEVPPTQILPTEVPPTKVPPTEVPPTKVPPTETPPPTNPIIDRVDLRYTTSAGTTTVYQDIYFRDGDGDVNYVTYQVTDISSGYYAETENGSVDVPAGQQKSGGMFTGTWTCNGIYDVTLLVTIYDSVGHQSNSISYTMNCY